jgi:putative transposase
MPYHSRATAKLLPGRLSLAGECYFLTWCTHDRLPGLTSPAVQTTLRAAISNLDQSRDAVLLAATIMPDHAHLLLTLGARLSVSQLVAKTKAAVTREHASVKWQINFFEHRLRNSASAEDFAFYIFMNPYMATLCRLDEVWPGWMPSMQIRWSFEDKLRDGHLPHAEWVPDATRFANTLPAGAD